MQLSLMCLVTPFKTATEKITFIMQIDQNMTQYNYWYMTADTLMCISRSLKLHCRGSCTFVKCRACVVLLL